MSAHIPLADEQLSEGSAGYDLTAAGDVVWPLADQQGTIRDLAVYDAATDTTSIATHITYDAYGNVTNTTHLNSTAVDCLFGYTSLFVREKLWHIVNVV